MNKTKKLYYEWGHGSVVYGKLLQSNAIKLQQFSPAVRKDLPCVSKRRASEWNLSKSVANKQTEEAVLANADLCDAVTASAVHCGVFLATHHLPLIKHWWVEQVINTTFAVHRCITHTHAQRHISGQLGKQEPRYSRLDATSGTGPFWRPFELCSLLKGCVSTHFWQCKQLNPSAYKWLSYSCHDISISHPNRSTKTADCV